MKNNKKAETKKERRQYETFFLKNYEHSAREGKSVYIIPEFHERLQRIVQTIGGNKQTIFSYLNNVLEQHFDEYKEDIMTMFNKQKPIF